MFLQKKMYKNVKTWLLTNIMQYLRNEKTYRLEAVIMGAGSISVIFLSDAYICNFLNNA